MRLADKVMAVLAPVLLLVACGQPAHPAGSDLRAVQRTLATGVAYGNTLVTMSDAELAAALEDAVMLGARWIRVDLSWNDVQPTSAAEYRWAAFDHVVAAASRRSLKVLPVVAYTPEWARPSGCTSDKCGPVDIAAYARFAGAAVKRYAPRGVTTWEIWNEPNTTFWLPRPDPPVYAKLLRAAVTAIKEKDAAATVVLGGLAAVRTDGEHVSQVDFVSRVCRDGAVGLVDAVAYHPYTYPYLASYQAPQGTPWSRIDQGPSNIRDTLRDCGSPETPVWITEYGAPTGGPGTAATNDPGSITDRTTHVTEGLQARIATDAVVTAAHNPDVGAFFWYSDRDLGTSPNSNENFYGLRRADGSRKPAFAALARALARLR